QLRHINPFPTRRSYDLPPEIKKNEKAKAIFIKAMEEDQRHYNEITETLFKDHFNKYIEEGLSERKAKTKAEKKAIEDARYIFPRSEEHTSELQSRFDLV